MDCSRVKVYVWMCLCLYKYVAGVVYVRGRGASFPHEVYKEWRSAYRLYRNAHVNLDMPYEAVGSGKGKEAIKENIDIEYAGSDSLLSTDTIASHPDLVLFPIMAGAVMLGYNIPGLGGPLVLSRSMIVGIFNGTYTWWNDTVFTSSNPGLNIPSKRIIVIARADKSGTTSIFTEALSAFSQEWSQQYGIFSKGINPDTELPYHWNSDVITYYGQQNRGVSGLILSFRDSIGYLSVADAYEADIASATIVNKAGRLITANSTTVQSAMDYFSEKSSELTFSLADGGSDLAYPIAGFTHIIMYKTTMKNCASAKELVRYLDWAMTSESERAACDNKGMAPLSLNMVEQVKSVVLKNIVCHGANVWDMVQSDKEAEGREVQQWVIPVSVTIPIVALCILCLCCYIIKQRMHIQKMIDNDEWLIPIEDILFYFDGRGRSSMNSRIADLSSVMSAASVKDASDDDILIKHIIQWPGKYRGNHIGIRLMEVAELDQLARQTKHQLLLLKNRITHANVVRMFGLTEVDARRYVIGDYCGKGKMTNLLRDDKFNLSNDFKCTLAGDVANGMHYLHSNDIVHGQLRSDSCLIDDRWQVKICDWEYVTLLSLQQANVSPILTMRKNSDKDLTTNEIAFKNFWISPEILRSDFTVFPSKDSDVYSFAIILQEIFTREEPYSEHAGMLTPPEVISAVTLNNLRPEHNEDTPVNIRQLMEICWNDNAISRPSFEQILKLLKRANPLKKTVIDSMMSSMEEYIAHLEERVEEKNAELKVSNNKLETTLSGLMPKFLAQRLSNGKSVKPMFISDIAVAILDISHSLADIENVNPNDVIAFINELCFEIDMLARKYSVYTTQMNGCSLALVYGVESSSSIKVDEMCLSMVNLGLDILSHEDIERLANSTEHQFDMRLGVHVGPAITGLSGIASPSYVVFGNCTDITQAIARTAPVRTVHVSESLWRNIKRSKQFEANTAGELSVKGMTFVTYTVKRIQEGVKYATSEDSGVGVEPQSQTLMECSDTKKKNDRLYKTSKKVNDLRQEAEIQSFDIVDVKFADRAKSIGIHGDTSRTRVKDKQHNYYHKRYSSSHRRRSLDFINDASVQSVQDSITSLPSEMAVMHTSHVGLPVSKEYVPVKSKWKRRFFANNIYPDN
ncbi:retinal guanylyl cyclase 1-like [Ylistrum balloti]|uniref:retinal guanylyl cyclase 1-like n=1 Tax=Ylistrum balloti TaxID=509963 RepID=UPI002905E99D|nr:retinal guanylyl cyclase 1-like [Ylistrum balloti]